jgi:hypothetical protein
MRRFRILKLSIFVTLFQFWSAATASADSDAPALWTGLTYSFTSTFEAPAEDAITPNVHISRSLTQGIFNSVAEMGYTHFSSPASTTWATEFNNDPGTTISASNWESLNFTDWESAYQGAGGLRSSITESPAVVYLELDDVYLDLQFTQWDAGRDGGNGGFSYLRAEPVPEPAAGLLVLMAVAAGRRRLRR